MQIKRFTGPSMSAALRLVKAEFGAEAVILETAAAAGGGVTVTAAIDGAEAPVAPAAGAAGDAPELVGEVRRLLAVVDALVGEQWRSLAPGLAPDLLPLHRGLAAQGVDGVIAAALVRATGRRLRRGAPLDAALARTLGRFAAPTDDCRVRLFVGPAGDGKTTTIVKLAARARQAGQRVALVGTDTYRVGAQRELERYGRLLDVPVAVAPDAAAFARALGSAADYDRVLVDTAGAAPAEEGVLAELAALADAAGPEAGRTLVLGAATGSWGAAQAWRAFAPLRPDRCVLTKLDVAPGGPLLGLCWRRRLPVTHLATGRRIPEDLELATPERLARCLLAA